MSFNSILLSLAELRKHLLGNRGGNLPTQYLTIDTLRRISEVTGVERHINFDVTVYGLDGKPYTSHHRYGFRSWEAEVVKPQGVSVEHADQLVYRNIEDAIARAMNGERVQRGGRIVVSPIENADLATIADYVDGYSAQGLGQPHVTSIVLSSSVPKPLRILYNKTLIPPTQNPAQPQ